MIFCHQKGVTHYEDSRKLVDILLIMLYFINYGILVAQGNKKYSDKLEGEAL